LAPTPDLTPEPTQAPTPKPTPAPTPEPAPARTGNVSADAAGRAPSLYCFMLVRPSYPELELVSAQLKAGVGIFACNGHAVISNESIVLRVGPEKEVVSEVIKASLDSGSKRGTALSAEVFVLAWRRVLALGRFRLHDWTVKADPDTVFLPAELGRRVASQPAAEAAYLNTCRAGLLGSLEAVSHGAAAALEGGLGRCTPEPKVSESAWLRRCLGLLAVSRVDDYELLRDRACEPFKDPSPCGAGAVAFHPLATPRAYMACLTRATLDWRVRDGSQAEG